MAKHQSRDRRINVEPARLAAEVSSSNEWCTIDRKTNFAYRSWGEPSHFSNAEKLIHGETFTQETFSPKHFLQRETFTFLFSQREGSAHRGFYTGKLSHPQWQQGICIPKTGSRCEKQKTILKHFFHMSLRISKRENHQRQWRKKNLFMQPRQILLWNFDATIPLRSAFIFSRGFFLLVAKRRAYLGGMRLGESYCPPIHQQRPTPKGMEGALKRQPWRSRGGPWNTPTRSSGPVTAADTLLHLPPQPPTTMAPASTWKSMWWCQRDGATFSRTHSSVSLGFIKMHRTAPERTVDLERLQSQLW